MSIKKSSPLSPVAAGMPLTWMVLLHLKSPATESNLYLQRIGCKYDLRTTFLNCCQSGFLWSPLQYPSAEPCAGPLWESWQISSQPHVPVAATSPGLMFCLVYSWQRYYSDWGSAFLSYCCVERAFSSSFVFPGRAFLALLTVCKNMH